MFLATVVLCAWWGRGGREGLKSAGIPGGGSESGRMWRCTSSAWNVEGTETEGAPEASPLQSGLTTWTFLF